MALTESQKVAIRRALGWPTWRTWDTYLESAMDLASSTSDGQAAIEAELARIAAVDTAIDNSLDGIEFVKAGGGNDSVELDPRRDERLRARGRRAVGVLASLLRVKVERDIYAAGWGGGALPLG